MAWRLWFDEKHPRNQGLAIWIGRPLCVLVPYCIILYYTL